MVDTGTVWPTNTPGAAGLPDEPYWVGEFICPECARYKGYNICSFNVFIPAVGWDTKCCQFFYDLIHLTKEELIERLKEYEPFRK